MVIAEVVKKKSGSLQRRDSRGLFKQLYKPEQKTKAKEFLPKKEANEVLGSLKEGAQEFRNRDRSNRSGRGQIEHNVLEGIPINQYREAEITIGLNSNDNKPIDKNAWPELPMPRDSNLLPEHSQQLLRAARSGRTIKPPAPPEDDHDMKEEEEESKEVQVGFTVKKFVKVARHLETPEPEYLAKRRRGLPSQYVNGPVMPTALRETKVQKLDAEGNIAVYKVLVPEGQVVDGEVQPTDAAIEVAPVVAAPGTIVEGVGVMNAEGVVVANDVMQQTPPKRRIIPQKKKRGNPNRGRRRVNFAEGDGGRSVSNATGDPLDPLAVSSLKREDDSVAPSDGGDTPMADAGGDDEEGSGDEGSEDEDHDMERTSTPTTPSKLPAAPTSAPVTDMPDEAPAESTPIPDGPAFLSVETSQASVASELPTLPIPAPETSEPATESVEKRELSNSPDLPMSTASHSRQNSAQQTVPSPPTADAVVLEIEPVISETVAVVEEAQIEERQFEEAQFEEAQIEEAQIEEAQIEEAQIEEAQIEEAQIEEAQIEVAQIEEAQVEETQVEEAQVEEAQVEEAQIEEVQVEEAEPVPAPVVVAESVAVQEVKDAPSAPPSEPDLLGSLERQLEKDSEDMAAS